MNKKTPPLTGLSENIGTSLTWGLTSTVAGLATGAAVTALSGNRELGMAAGEFTMGVGGLLTTVAVFNNMADARENYQEAQAQVSDVTADGRAQAAQVAVQK